MDEERKGLLAPEQKDYLLSLAGRYSAVALIVGLATLAGYLVGDYIMAYVAFVLAVLVLRW